MHSTIKIRRLISISIAVFAATWLSSGIAAARDRDSKSHRSPRIDRHYEAIALVAAFAAGYQLAELWDRHGDRSLRHHDRRGEPIVRHAARVKHRHAHGCGHPLSVWRSPGRHFDHSRGHGHLRHQRRHGWRGQHLHDGHRRHHDRH